MAISNVESNEYYDAGIEVFEGTAYLHCTVYKYTPSVKKRLMHLIECAKVSCREQGLIGPYGLSPDEKFSRLVGGTWIKDIEHENRKLGVFKWE